MTPCIHTCGYAVALRGRMCDNPEPEFGGEDCRGDHEERIDCDLPKCPGKK